jgi:hypothetical protein
MNVVTQANYLAMFMHLPVSNCTIDVLPLNQICYNAICNSAELCINIVYEEGVVEAILLKQTHRETVLLTL